MEYINLLFSEIYKILYVLIPVLVSVAMIVWLDRRIWAFVQKRRGPNVVGPFGLFQTLADALKYIFKEIIIPASSNKIIFILAPIVTMTLALIAWAVIPFSEDYVLADINVGILYIFAISSLGVYGIIMGGWASNSKYPFLGSIRSAAQMVSYEVSIGVIIIALQIGPLLGISTRGGVVESLTTVLSNFQPNGAAIGVAVMTLGIVFLTPRKISQWVPSPLLALLIVTPISILIFGDGAIDRIGEIPRGVPSLNFPSFNQYFPIIFKAGLVLAVLGAIDSLLTSLVADNISQTKHNSDRELIGQGIGNAVAGLFSGLPGAGATMRTVINVKSGGSTPLSGMVHSVVLLIVLVGAGPLAEQIPTALLAGILIKVGLDIIDWGFLRRAHKLSLKTSVVMYGVLLMTVFWDLIWAVLVGVFIANMLTIDSITETQLEGMDEDNPLSKDDQAKNALPADEKALLDRCSGEVMLFRLKGPLSFGAAKGISERMMLVRNYKVLIIDITDVPRLGVTATLAIEDMMQEAKNNSRKAFVAGANEKVKVRLAKFGVEGIIETRKEALEAALNEIAKNLWK